MRQAHKIKIMMHVIKTGFKQSKIKDKRQIKQKIARRYVDHSLTLWYSFYYNSRMFLVDHVLHVLHVLRFVEYSSKTE